MKPYFEDRQRGGFNYVTVILLLIVVAIGMAAVYIAPKYYANYMLQHELHGLMVKANELGAKGIQSSLAEMAQERNIPLSINQISCYFKAKTLLCQYEFEWPAGVPGLDDWKLKFAAAMEREVSEVKQF